MKKYIFSFFCILIIIGILIISFLRIDNDPNKKTSSTKDIKTKVSINDKYLDVTYKDGNIIDTSVSYGNKISKIIKIENKNNEDIPFALSLNEVVISDNSLNINLFYSYDNIKYNELKSNLNITNDANIAYNLVCEHKNNIYLKLEFIGKNENEQTKMSMHLNIVSNITDKDVFKAEIIDIHSKLLERISSLNGINEKGYFILNVNELNDNYKGFILIDAKDYSSLEYHYYIYNDKYMLNDYIYKNELSLKKIEEINNDIINNYNFTSICKMITKKECLDFNSLKYNEQGGKDNFLNLSMNILEKLKESFNKDRKVYIYDVKNDIDSNTSIRGYILVDNTKDNPEYYLYLTNDIYMISGYNYTKLGSINKDANTIRAYSPSSFKLSSENSLKVCEFSGFKECFNKNNELIK